MFSALIPESGFKTNIARGPVGANFGREPPFLLRGLSYMRDLPQLAWMMATVSYSKIAI